MANSFMTPYPFISNMAEELSLRKTLNEETEQYSYEYGPFHRKAYVVTDPLRSFNDVQNTVFIKAGESEDLKGCLTFTKQLFTIEVELISEDTATLYDLYAVFMQTYMEWKQNVNTGWIPPHHILMSSAPIIKKGLEQLPLPATGVRMTISFNVHVSVQNA